MKAASVTEDIVTKYQPSGWRTFPAPENESAALPGKECDRCGGRQFEVVSRRDRKGKALDTAVCVRCGLVAHLNVPSDKELAEFYSHHYREEYHGETTPSPRRVVRAWRNGQ